MGEEESKNIVSELIPRNIFCPLCGGKLQGLYQGKKDVCGYDDCKAKFSLRIYDFGQSIE